jgi:hypothetical protein
MNSINQLFLLDPFDFSNKAKETFLDSLKECFDIHRSNNDYIDYFYQENDFNSSDLVDEKSIENMPFIMINIFKEHEFKSVKDEELVLTLSSSGTSGQKSLQHLNQSSLDRVKLLARNVYESLGIISDKKYNYLCFTYDPKIANDLGTAFTDELLTSFTGVNEVFYAIEYIDEIKDFKFNLDKTIAKLKEFENNGYSTRILGFPAFLYSTINDNDLNLDLGEDSWVQIGGGWKGQADKEINKNDFRDFVSSRLNIPKSNIRDLFGMVEHGIPYVDSDLGELKIPNYSRVFIRDPYTLKILPIGEVGLIQFICTYNTSYPAFNFLSTDWGYISLSSDGSQNLNIVGRAGNSKSKGCAITASELLKG